MLQIKQTTGFNRLAVHDLKFLAGFLKTTIMNYSIAVDAGQNAGMP